MQYNILQWLYRLPPTPGRRVGAGTQACHQWIMLRGPFLNSFLRRSSSQTADGPLPPFQAGDIVLSPATEKLVQKHDGAWPVEHGASSKETGSKSFSKQPTSDDELQLNVSAEVSHVARGEANTPSNYLISALRDGGFHSSLPAYGQGKIDLSVNRAADPGRPLWEDDFLKVEKGSAQSPPVTKMTVPRRSLPVILARYIRYVHPFFDRGRDLEAKDTIEGLRLVYTSEVIDFLETEGYAPEDVMTWAWIVTSNTPTQVSERLTIVSLKSPGPPIPIFLVLFILRRPRLSATAVGLMLLHAWQRILLPYSSSRQAIYEAPDYKRLARPWKPIIRHYRPLDSSTFMLLSIRLLRHARREWAPGLPSIASMISAYFGHSNEIQKTRSATRNHAKLTFSFNRFLSLLAVPSSLNPFAALQYHQRAQFNLLQTMAELQPPVPVTKEGYRGIIRVQTAHRKTMQEREWARYKARSWPPWKVERVGIDAERGDEGKMSRAAEALNRMQEAGYDHREFEDIARIFAGWDTDGSPTIQTLTILPRAPVVDRGPEGLPDVWAARIRATRTLKEAWACLLARVDAKATPHKEQYYAMAEKIMASSRRTLDETAILPGDAKEVHPEPISPREMTYVRSPVPTLGQLIDLMMRDNIQLSGRFLAYCLSHASSIGVGLRYLKRSNLSDKEVRTLVDHDNVETNARVLNSLPDYLFAAFVQLLCRNTTIVSEEDIASLSCLTSRSHPQKMGNVTLPHGYIRYYVPQSTNRPGLVFESPHRTLRDSRSLVSRINTRVNPLMHAIRLMKYRRSSYRPPWIAILESLSSTKSRISGPGAAQTKWKMAVQVVGEMQRLSVDLDFESIRLVCTALERAILASLRNSKKSHLKQPRQDFRILWDGVKLVKVEFEKLVSTRDFVFGTPSNRDGREGSNVSSFHSTLQIPPIRSVPLPAHLHALIRVLGLAGDNDALLMLLRWLDRYHAELADAAREVANGERLMRRCLVAIRVFLEQSWLEGMVDPGTLDSGRAPEDVIQAAFEIMETRREEWGGWPDHEEVDAYVGVIGWENTRFPV